MKPNTKWWGWGDPATHFRLDQHPKFTSYLRDLTDIPAKPVLAVPDFADIHVPDCRLSDNDIRHLESILAPNRIDCTREARIIHAYGKSYKDLLRIRLKHFETVPDAVVIPDSEEEVQAIIKWAAEQDVAVIPRGGGTSVVGGVETHGRDRRSVIMDLHRLCNIIHIDTISLVAEVQAGIYGPALESALHKHGLTLAHYPESFEYSTLGGWIAARSAGQQSTLYGKIEDMVESLTIVMPDGILKTFHVPAAANGPDLNRLIIGSEGIFGVITRARMKLRPLPEKKYYTGYLFPSFADGVECCREIVQRGVIPAAIRLSDAEETNFIFSLLERPASALKTTLLNLGLAWLQSRGYKPGKRAFMLIGLEGAASHVSFQQKSVRSITKKYDGYHLGKQAGDHWYQQRFANPYRRDALMDYGLLVDTLETATEWHNVPRLHRSVIDVITGTLHSLRIRGVAFAHLSHMYATGSSIYYIIIASPKRGKELEQWDTIKRAASDTIVRNGGTISHHHGVGIDHKKWLKEEIGDAGVRLLKEIKSKIDPNGILNPGKIIDS